MAASDALKVSTAFALSDFIGSLDARGRSLTDAPNRSSACQAWVICRCPTPVGSARVTKPKDERDSLVTLLTEVLADQAKPVHSHETFGEYRSRLIAGELASAKAREAALRAEVMRGPARFSPALAAAGFGQLHLSNSGISTSGMNRVREA